MSENFINFLDGCGVFLVEIESTTKVHTHFIGIHNGRESYFRYTSARNGNTESVSEVERKS